MNSGFAARNQVDFSLVSHEEITEEVRDLFFVGSEQALDPTVLPVGPSAFDLLDVKKFDRSSWFESVFVVSETNHEPRRGRFMHNGSDPLGPASENGSLEILSHGESSYQIAS
jgi:hypothetical protein